MGTIKALKAVPDFSSVGTADLDAVRVFVQVVQAGGFTAAARRLDMPKSTVSRRVAELEAQLGARLLQRSTRSLALTDVGKAYYARVERALAELADAEAVVGELRGTPRGVLRMTAPVDMTETFLLGLVAEYERKYPEVALVIDLDNRRTDLVAEGYDLALRGSAHLDDSSLVAKRLLTEVHGLVASPKYLAEHGEPLQPKDLEQHEALLFRSEKLRARWKLSRGDEQVEVEARGRVSSNDLGFLRRAAVEGMGIAALPLSVCCAYLRSNQLQRVLPEYGAGASSVFAVYPSARHVTPKVRAFVELAASQLEMLSREAQHAGRGHSALPPR